MTDPFLRGTLRASSGKFRSGNESGNVFVIIILGVVLFGALMFIASRGMNESPQSVSDKRARVVAAEVLSTAQTLERSVGRLLSRGISENNVSFENSEVAGYDYSGCTSPECMVFSPKGGGISWPKSSEDANDGSPWLFTGGTCIADIGQGGAGCDTNGVADEELVAVLPNVKKEVCAEIDARLGISGIPVNSADGYSVTKFLGTFADGASPDNMDGQPAGCFDGGAAQPGYHFYMVLEAR